MYKPPLPQLQLDRTPITCDRTVLSKTYAIGKKAERHNLAKLMTCAIILLPANLAFSAPTYLGSQPSAEADSAKFTQKVNIILAQDSTQVPLSIRYGGTEARGGFVLMQLTAPNRDTTQPAYGGKLRLYDVHLAKMFETSHFLCQQFRRVSGYEWVYSAGNGSIRMGNFRIPCSLASEIASTYGLGKPERTSIAKDTEGGPPESDVYSIPILDITGSKVQRWMNFVQNFKPTSRDR
jgi:serine/threonine-protein kinase